MIYRFVGAIVALTFSLTVTATAALAALKTPLRLHLTYYPTVEFAGLFLAYEKGWYRDAGIDLKFYSKDLNISESLNSDEVDVAMHSGHEVIRQVAMGQDVKAFAAEYQINPLSLAVDPKIKTLKDLKGKTIGIFTDQEKSFIRVMLAHEGLNLSEVKFKYIQSFKFDDLLDDLRLHSFDALPVWAFNHPVGFAIKGYNTRQFQSYLYGFHFYGTVYYAKSKTIKNRQKELADFLSVTRRGWQEAYKNPEAAVTAVMKNWYPKENLIDGSYDLTLKQQLTQMKLAQRYLYEGVGAAHFAEMTRAQWQSGLKIALRDGIIENRNIKVDDLFTDDILKILRRGSK